MIRCPFYFAILLGLFLYCDNACGYFAFLVGPPVIGFVGEHTGVLHALLITLLLASIGALVSGAAREPGRRKRKVDTFENPVS